MRTGHMVDDIEAFNLGYENSSTTGLREEYFRLTGFSPLRSAPIVPHDRNQWPHPNTGNKFCWIATLKYLQLISFSSFASSFYLKTAAEGRRFREVMLQLWESMESTSRKLLTILLHQLVSDNKINEALIAELVKSHSRSMHQMELKRYPALPIW
jgi:hypothetical protein